MARVKKFCLVMVIALLVAVSAGLFAPLNGFATLVSRAEQLAAGDVALGTETDGFGYVWHTETEQQPTTKIRNGIATIDYEAKTYRLVSSAQDLRAIDPISSDISVGNNADLESLKENLGADYKLTNDITISLNEDENWVPIGVVKPFTGTFDGAGYKISGLKIDISHEYSTPDRARYTELGSIPAFGEYEYEIAYIWTETTWSTYNHQEYLHRCVFGLFGQTQEANIKNLSITEPYIFANPSSCLDRSFLGIPVVDGCIFTMYAGAIAGKMNGGLITNCYVNNPYIYMQNDTRMDVPADNNKDGDTPKEVYVGGIVGLCENGDLNYNAVVSNQAGQDPIEYGQSVDMGGKGHLATTLSIGGIAGKYVLDLNSDFVIRGNLVRAKLGGCRLKRIYRGDKSSIASTYVGGLFGILNAVASSSQNLHIYGNYAYLDSVYACNSWSDEWTVEGGKDIDQTYSWLQPMACLQKEGILFVGNYKYYLPDDAKILEEAQEQSSPMSYEDDALIYESDNFLSETSDQTDLVEYINADQSDAWRENSAGNLPIQDVFAYTFEFDGDNSWLQSDDVFGKYFSRLDVDQFSIDGNELKVGSAKAVLQDYSYAYKDLEFNYAGDTKLTPKIENRTFKINVDALPYAVRVDISSIYIDYADEESVEYYQLMEYVDMSTYLNFEPGSVGTWEENKTANPLDDTCVNHVDLEEVDENAYVLKVFSSDATNPLYTYNITNKNENFEVVGFVYNKSGNSFGLGGSCAINSETVDDDAIINITICVREKTRTLSIGKRLENMNISLANIINGNIYGMSGFVGGINVNLDTKSSNLNIDIPAGCTIKLYNVNATASFEGANTGYLIPSLSSGYSFVGWLVDGVLYCPADVTETNYSKNIEKFNNETYHEYTPSGSRVSISAVFGLIDYQITAWSIDDEHNETIHFDVLNGITSGKINGTEGFSWVVITDGEGRVVTKDVGDYMVEEDLKYSLNSTVNNLHTITITKDIQTNWVFVYNTRIRDVNGYIIYFITDLSEGSFGNSAEIDIGGKKTIILRKTYEYNLTIDDGVDANSVPKNEEYQFAGITYNNREVSQVTSIDCLTMPITENAYYPFMATTSVSTGMAFYNKNDYINTSRARATYNANSRYWYAVYNYGHHITNWTIKIDAPEEITNRFGELYFVIYKDASNRKWGIYSTKKEGILKVTSISDEYISDDGWETWDGGTQISPEDLYNQFISGINAAEYTSMGEMINVLTSAFASYGHVNFALTMTPTWQAVQIDLKDATKSSAPPLATATYNEPYTIDTLPVSRVGQTFAYYYYASNSAATYAILSDAVFNYQSLNKTYISFANGKYSLSLNARFLNNIYMVKLEGINDLDPLKLDENDSTSRYYYKIVENTLNYNTVYTWSELESFDNKYYTYYDFFESDLLAENEAIKDNMLVDDYLNIFLSNYVGRYTSYISFPTSYNSNDYIGQIFESNGTRINYQFKNPKLLLNVFKDDGENHFIFLTNGVTPQLPAFNKVENKANYTLNYWTDGAGIKYLTRVSDTITDDETQPSSTPYWNYNDQLDYLTDIGDNQVPYLTPNFYREHYLISVTFSGNYGYIILKVIDNLIDETDVNYCTYYLCIINDGSYVWYEYNGDEIYEDTKHWEIDTNTYANRDLLSGTNLKVFSGSDVYFYLGDQSTSPEAMKTGTYDSMIGRRIYGFYSLYTLAHGIGMYNSANEQVDTGGTYYIYEMLADDVSNQNFINNRTITVSPLFTTIEYTLKFQLDDSAAGSIEILNNNSGANLSNGELTDITVDRSITINFTYNAKLGYEFKEKYPYVLIVSGVDGSTYTLPLILLDSLRLTDEMGNLNGYYQQTYTFSITSAWLRENYYYPINTLGVGDSNYQQQYLVNANFLVRDADLGTMEIGTKLIDFNLKIKFKDDTKTSDEYFVDEDGNTLYTSYVDENGEDNLLTLFKNRFNLKIGYNQLGLEILAEANRADGGNCDIYIKNYQGITYTIVRSYAEAYAYPNNISIDARAYSLPYLTSTDNVYYNITNNLSNRVNFQTNRIVNDNDRTLYYVYVMTPLLTITIVGEPYDPLQYELNVDTRAVTVSNTTNYTYSSGSSIGEVKQFTNSATYTLTAGQKIIKDESGLEFWQDDAGNKLISILYSTKNLNSTINSSYNGKYYEKVEYSFHGELLSNANIFGSMLNLDCSTNILTVKFIPKQLELEVNYYVHDYDDNGNDLGSSKVEFSELKARNILNIDTISFLDNELYLGNTTGFYWFDFSSDYILTVSINNDSYKFNKETDFEGDIYSHVITKDDFDFGKIVVDFEFSMNDNNMVTFFFGLAGEGKRADDNYGSFEVYLYQDNELTTPTPITSDANGRASVRVLKGRRIVVNISPNKGYTFVGYIFNAGNQIETSLTSGLELTGANGYEAERASNYTLVLKKDMYNLNLTYTNSDATDGVLGSYGLQAEDKVATAEAGKLSLTNVYVGMEICITREEDGQEAFAGYYFEKGEGEKKEKYYAYTTGWFKDGDVIVGDRVLSKEFRFTLNSSLIKLLGLADGGTFDIYVEHSIKYAMELLVYDNYNELIYNVSPAIVDLTNLQPLYYAKGSVITIDLSARFSKFNVKISGIDVGLSNGVVPENQVGAYTLKVTLNKNYLKENAIKIEVSTRSFDVHIQNNLVYNNLNGLNARTPDKADSSYANTIDQTSHSSYGFEKTVNVYEEIGTLDKRATLKYIKVSGNDFVGFEIKIDSEISVTVLDDSYTAKISGDTITITDAEGNMKQFTLNRTVENGITYWNLTFTLVNDVDIVCEYVDYKTISEIK